MDNAQFLSNIDTDIFNNETTDMDDRTEDFQQSQSTGKESWMEQWLRETEV